MMTNEGLFLTPFQAPTPHSRCYMPGPSESCRGLRHLKGSLCREPGAWGKSIGQQPCSPLQSPGMAVGAMGQGAPLHLKSRMRRTELAPPVA